MLERVISSVQSSASYINNGRGEVEAQTCLVVPKGDPIAKTHGHHITIFQGPEHDVLRRYYDAMCAMDPDYIVRITADCPMLPAFVTTKHILSATKHNFDYVTNTREEMRTCPDGHDVEVISKRLMQWAHQAATSDYDREHVTSVIKERLPSWARDANIIGYTDNSHLKISVDTQNDLEFVRTYDEMLNKKIRLAKSKSNGFFRI
jgi:spore coat polysaccharide biosynthesis protein SpsF (cytidylyltransferase family)